MSTLASADRFRSLVDGSRDAVLIVDVSGRCLAASAAAEALLGYGRNELQRCQVDDLSAGFDAPPITGWRGSMQLLGKHGDVVRTDVWTMPLSDSTGTTVAIYVRLTGDAGDGAADAPSGMEPEQSRSRAERELRVAKATAIDANRALRESEARFRGAFDGASIGMALVAVDGRFLQVNPALCGILGYTEAELLGTTFPEITHPDHLDTDQELLHQLRANAIPSYQIEKYYVRKDGEVICGRLTVSLVRDAGNAPLYFVAQVQDITPFKAAGAALREAEARYRMLVEQTPASVYVDAADQLGTPLYISPRVEKVLGFTPEAWLAAPDLRQSRLHPDDRQRIMAEIARANASGEAVQLEYRFLTADGREVWIHDEAAPVYDDEGIRQCWQGFMLDITDRKLAEVELRAAKEAAEEASRLKSAFLSMATHELRTPLTIISGYIELLAESAAGHLSQEERDYLEVTQSSTKNLAALVNDILDLARIEAGRFDVVIRPVDVAEVVERVRRMVAAQAVAKGLDLAVEIAPDLPPVAADNNRLVQVLLNLFGNAIKFTEQGIVRGRARPRGNGVEIAVSDTGIGIAADVLPRIFDEFRQADSGTTRRFGGTGLGLAIARRLVEMHHGTIAVESTVGVGSTFTIWVPAAEDSVPDGADVEREAVPSGRR